MARSRFGSKRKVGNVWEARVRSGYRSDGGQRELRETFETEPEADEWLAKMRVTLGRLPNAGDSMTLGDYYRDFFVPEREGYLTHATMRRYDGDWKRHIEPAFGDRPMDSIRHPEVQALVLTLTRSQAKHVVSALRAILRSAWDDGLLDSEPMRHRLRLPRSAEQQRGVWDAPTVARAMSAMSGTPLEALWLVMVGGGLRREEAYALYWRDLSFESAPSIGGGESTMCRAVVDDAVTIEDGRKGTKTAFSRRVVSIADPFASRLAEIAGEPDDQICGIALTSVNRSWRKLWEEPPKRSCPSSYRGRMLEAGVPYLEPSRMRATHETIMQAAGVPDTLNARAHGRADSSQVGYRNYLNPQNDALDAAAGEVGRAVGGA